MLSDSESDSGNNDEHQLTINEHYAKAFQHRKEREELARLKEKYGSDYGEESEDSVSDSESDESEDEDGEELTPAVDAAILRTLARIKRKDPEIYQSGKEIFTEEKDKIFDIQPRSNITKKDKVSKPITVRQVALEAALNPSSRSPSPERTTFADEQHALREEAIAAFRGSGSSDDDDDELLVPREKTKDEIEREDEEYREFLQRQVGSDIGQLITVDPDTIRLDVEDDDTILVGSDRQRTAKPKGKKRAKVDKEADDQEFLMNYILNRGWVDRSSKRVPTYKEITNENKQEDPLEDDAWVDEDEEFEDIVDHFESSYNFRFEEPDAAVIKTYPRNITTVRREENPRKAARERKQQRKEEKLTQKREEINRLKALKLKDLRSKLDRIGHEGGKELDDEVLRELDLDGDWDPEKHDVQMADLYEGVDADVDGKKPVWDDDIDIGDVGISAPVETSSKKKKKKKKRDDDSVQVDNGVDVAAMDADDPNLHDESDEEWDGTEEMRKRKVAKYMEELYNLDFNDMVGDMPTRFKYTTVRSQSYDLTPAEILMATDAELNEYMGIKRVAPYRKDPKWDPKRAERLKDFKRKLVERSGATGNVEQERPAKKRKGKKERMKFKETVTIDSLDPITKQEGEGVLSATAKDGKDAEPAQKRRRHKKAKAMS